MNTIEEGDVKEQSPYLSVITPVYNNEHSLTQLVDRTCRTLRSSGLTFEFILVDDGSKDRSYAVLKELAQQFPELNILHLPNNRGQHFATLTGLKESSGRIVVTMDADLQVSPEEIPRLLMPLQEDEEIDVASGKRTIRSHRKIRSISSHLISRILNRMCKTKLKDLSSSFKAFRRPVIDFAIENEILALNLPLFVAFVGFTIHEIDIEYKTPPEQKSRYHFMGLLYLFVVTIINFTAGFMPLAWLMFLGMSLILLGSLFLFGLLIWAFYDTGPLRTNVLLFGIYLMLFGGHFAAISFLGFQLESLRRNLKLFNSPVMRYKHK